MRCIKVVVELVIVVFNVLDSEYDMLVNIIVFFDCCKGVCVCF